MPITILFKGNKLINKLAERGYRNFVIRATTGDSPTLVGTPVRPSICLYLPGSRKSKEQKAAFSARLQKQPLAHANSARMLRNTGNCLYQTSSTSHAGTYTRLQVNHVCNVCCFSSAAAAATATKSTISTRPGSSNKTRKDVNRFACHIREGVVPGQP